MKTVVCLACLASYPSSISRSQYYNFQVANVTWRMSEGEQKWFRSCF